MSAAVHSMPRSTPVPFPAGCLVDTDFAVTHDAGFGNAVFVAGSAPQLGAWDTTRALRLDWSPGHIWRGRAALPRDVATIWRPFVRSESPDDSADPGAVTWLEQDCTITPSVRLNGRHPVSLFSLANQLHREGHVFEAALIYKICSLTEPSFRPYQDNLQRGQTVLNTLRPGRKVLLHPSETPLMNLQLRVADALLSHRHHCSDEVLALCLEMLQGHPEIDLYLANLATPADTSEWLARLNSYLAAFNLRPATLTSGAPRESIFQRLQFASGPSAHGDLVSICMTTFNAADTVGYAVKSVLEQDYKDLELIIVDDASTDGTRDLLATLAREDQRIRLIFNKENSGTYVGRNTALTEAKGRFFTVNDSDDLAHPQRLSLQLRELAEAPASAIGHVAQWVRMTHRGEFIQKNGLTGGYNHFAVATLLFKREVALEKIGHYDRVRIGSDMEYLGRLRVTFGEAALLRGESPLFVSASSPSSLAADEILEIGEVYGSSEARQALTAAWQDGRDSGPIQHLAPKLIALPFPAPNALTSDRLAALSSSVPRSDAASAPTHTGQSRSGRQYKAEKNVKLVTTKLHSLGFTEEPLRELKELTDHPQASWAAFRELILWHIRSGTWQGFSEALKHIENAKARHRNQDAQSALLLFEMICCYLFHDKDRGIRSYEQAQRGGLVTPDIKLARLNFEDSAEERLAQLNDVLSHYNLERITLTPDNTHLPVYDRLSSTLSVGETIAGPKVTVLVAAYESSDVLPTALRSLQQQTYRNLEILVIDDCSPTSAMADIMESFAAADHRIRLIRLNTNGGAYVARNVGLEEATGEFVTLHDADDWSHPRKIECQVAFLQQNPSVFACMSQQARSSPDLQFTHLNASGRLVMLNTSSMMLRTQQFKETFGGWDSVRFEADTELKDRIRSALGGKAVKTLGVGPLSFQRLASTSATRDAYFGSRGFTYGARFNYREAANQHRQKNSDYYYPRGSVKRLFATPQRMLSNRGARSQSLHYPVVMATDFRMAGGSTRSTIEEMRCHKQLAIPQALFFMFRYDLQVKRSLFAVLNEYFETSELNVLSYGDQISCDLLILRYPPILQHRQRYLPSIKAGDIRVIVNQPPMSDYGAHGVVRYDLATAAENLLYSFGKSATWHPIGPLVRQALHDHHADALHHIDLSPEDWVNIMEIDGWFHAPRQRFSGSKLRIGRHARDSVHKWPPDKNELLSVYPAADDVEVHVLGGSKAPNAILGSTPSNWVVHEFGSMHPREFLKTIDVWVYFANPDWVESFGRTIIEAMAAGRPVILPDFYRPLFGTAAIYSTPEEAVAKARQLWCDTDAYARQSQIAYEYVATRFSHEVHARRLKASLTSL